MNKTMAGVTLAATLASLPAGARAQDAREGPIEIEKCQTIDQPGSYKLVNNLSFTADTGSCLLITVSAVTIDLAGFTISGPGNGSPSNVNRSVGIAATETQEGKFLPPQGLAVRNGSISGFGEGVLLGVNAGSVVEGLHVFGGVQGGGISAMGIVKGNTVVDIVGGVGIAATGIVNWQLRYQHRALRDDHRRG